MSWKPLGRRTFLRGAGGVAVALPWLEGMGQAQTRAKRFVVFNTPEGYGPDRENWASTGTANNLRLSRILAPLERHKSKLIVLEGLDNEVSYHGATDNGHPEGVGSLLSGVSMEPDGPDTKSDHLAGGGATLDYVLGQKIGGETPFRALTLGVQNKSLEVFATLSYQGPREPVPIEDDPGTIFKKLFPGQTPGMAGSGSGGGNSKLPVRRRIVLDAVLGDLKDLSAKVGVEDRRRLDSHVSALRDIEKRLGMQATGPACQTPALDGAIDYMSEENFPAAGKLMMDLLAMALACDLTRVATLMWSKTGSEVTHRWAGINDMTHHELSHGPPDRAEDQVKIQVWYEQQFAYFLDKVASVQEGSYSLLDNSAIFRSRELQNSGHGRRNMPWLLAGSCGGYFKNGTNGRLLPTNGGVPHNNLLVSLMNAMGVEGKTFGDPDYCTGPLPGLV